MFTNEDLQDLYAKDIKELWNMASELEDEELNRDHKKIKDTIRNGHYMRGIPIQYFTEEWYELHPECRTVIIYGYATYKITDFIKEKEHREKLLRQLLQENQEKEPTRPRIR